MTAPKWPSELQNEPKWRPNRQKKKERPSVAQNHPTFVVFKKIVGVEFVTRGAWGCWSLCVYVTQRNMKVLIKRLSRGRVSSIDRKGLCEKHRNVTYTKKMSSYCIRSRDEEIMEIAVIDQFAENDAVISEDDEDARTFLEIDEVAKK